MQMHGGEKQIHRGFPCMNSGLESCSEFGIEEVGGPQGVVILGDFDDVPDLVQIVPVNVSLCILMEHLANAALTYLVNGGVAELINCHHPLMTIAGHRLHLIDPSRNVEM